MYLLKNKGDLGEKFKSFWFSFFREVVFKV